MYTVHHVYDPAAARCLADTMLRDVDQFGEANVQIVKALRALEFQQIALIAAFEPNRALIGLCLVDVRDRSLAHVYVSATRRRRGIGAALVRAAIRDWGVESVDAQVECVSFYRACGFVLAPNGGAPDDTVAMMVQKSSSASGSFVSTAGCSTGGCSTGGCAAAGGGSS